MAPSGKDTGSKSQEGTNLKGKGKGARLGVKMGNLFSRSSSRSPGPGRDKAGKTPDVSEKVTAPKPTVDSQCPILEGKVAAKEPGESHIEPSAKDPKVNAQSSKGPERTASELVLRPISELWDEAYDKLYDTNKSLISEYEEYIAKDLGLAIVFSGLGKVQRQQQMKLILEKKIQEVDDATWKLRFKDHELAVKDLVEPVVGVIDWAKDYVGGAVEASPPAAIAWAGVCLLLPLVLNPSKQTAARVKGLDEVASILRQCSLREELYSRRYGAGGSGQITKDSISSHIGYRDALRNLYLQVLTFQATSFCFLSKHFLVRTASEMAKWNEWESLLKEVKKEEMSLKSFEVQWKEMKLEEKWELIKAQHQQKLEGIKEVEKEISRVTQIIRDAQKNEERQRLLKWLSSVDPSTNYNSARKAHERSTGNWLINENAEFQRWKEAPNSFIWLHGQAGVGKSFLSSSVIHHLKNSCDPNPHAALAYFYFSFKDREKQDCTNMLRSLIVQLCGRRPDTPQSLLALKRYDIVSQNPDLESLEATLKATTEEFESVYLVLDALDECPKLNDERATVLKVLGRILTWSLPHLHILVTSRREPDIEADLALPIISIVDLQKHREEIDRDIGILIDQRLATSEFDSWPSDIKENARVALIEKSDGMFQYVALQLNTLKDTGSPDAIQAALKDLPPGLDELYERVILSIPTSQHKQAIRALKWLAFSIEPLNLAELAEAAVIDLDTDSPFSTSRRLFEPKQVLIHISGLVSIRNRIIDRIVEFSHFSVKEYLISDRASKMHFLNENHCNVEIAESCWQYISYIAEHGFDDAYLNSKARRRDFPLYEYSAKYWAKHIEEVPRKAWKHSISKMALSILQPSDNIFSFWRSYVMKDRSPLYYAAEGGYLQLCKLLVEDGREDINKIGSRHGTALIAACYCDYEDVAQFLIDNGADPCLGNGNWKFALEAVLSSRNEAMVRLLLKQPEVLEHCEKINFFPLVYALRNSLGVNILKLLLEKGADSDGHEERGDSALVWAVRMNNLDAVKLLLQYRADPNIRETGKISSPVLFLAARVGNQHMVKLLLDHGADPLLRFGIWKNCVQTAVYGGGKITNTISIIKHLLLHGARVDPPDEEWDNLINDDVVRMAARRNLEALQKVCGEMSRTPGGFTEKNIDAYMDKLGEALESIWKNFNLVRFA